MFIAISHLTLIVGIFCGQFIGNYITYYWLAIIPLTITGTFIVMMVTLKETPRWLISRGRKIGARTTLIWLHGSDHNVDKKMIEIEEQLDSEEKLNISEIVYKSLRKDLYTTQ